MRSAVIAQVQHYAHVAVADILGFNDFRESKAFYVSVLIVTVFNFVDV